jgi:hypothetical protein
MRKIFLTLPLAALILGNAGEASAQTATVTYEVSAINEMSLASSTASLTVSSATAGSAPDDATSATTWAITTNETSTKVTGEIDQAMPTGVTLAAQLAAPAGATSAGSVGLGIVAADLVTGITALNESGLALDYTLSATAAAGVIASDTRTVTYTVVAGI